MKRTVVVNGGLAGYITHYFDALVGGLGAEERVLCCGKDYSSVVNFIYGTNVII